MRRELPSINSLFLSLLSRKIDMIINEKYSDKEKAKETILLQINKWYKDNLNIDKETIETFLYYIKKR